MEFLDSRAESVEERLWLVSNSDGTREIVADSERNGRGGHAAPWNLPYRDVLASFVNSLEGDSLSWLKFYGAYMRGKQPTKGPLGSGQMPAISFVSGAHTYTAYIGTHHKGHFLGFGGQVATITMDDGTVYTSNNVWSGRDVPPKLRSVLRDNAKIEWSNRAIGEVA